MKITQEEAENVMNMLLSPDTDNAYLAFQSIEAYDFDKDNMGYLLYFFKFSKYPLDKWEENSPKSAGILKNFVEIDKPLTYAKAIQWMIEYKTDLGAIELTLKRHVKELTDMLKSMGYPTEKLVIDIKLKTE
jgi:hypothetical protein